MSAANSLSSLHAQNDSWRESIARFTRRLDISTVALVLLIVATALNRYRVDVGSLGFRPEHFALLLVGAIYAYKLFRREWRPVLTRDDIPLALYLAVALIASLLNAPQPRESLKFLALMIGCVLMYLLTKSIVTDAALFRRGVIVLLVVGVAEALAGVIFWVLYFRGADLGVELYPLVFSPRNVVACTFSPFGTLVESNIFGSYILPVALILIFLFLSARVRTWRWLFVFAIGAALVGLALSLTRSVWVAFALGLVLVLLFAANRRRIAVLLPFFAIAIIIGIIASNVLIPCTFVINADETVSTVPGSAPATVRVTPPQNTTAPTTSTPVPRPQIAPPTTTRITTLATILQRLGTYEGVIQDWLKNPLLGNGANAFGQSHLTSSHTPGWISNATLMALHDTGIIGLAILAFWFWWIGRDVVRVLKRVPSSVTRTALLALGIAFVGLLIVYQSTTSLWLGYTWVYLGLIRAGTLILQRGQGEA